MKVYCGICGKPEPLDHTPGECLEELLPLPTPLLDMLHGTQTGTSVPVDFADQQNVGS